MDFSPRHNLDNSDLLSLFKWTENEFLTKTEGSPIRRIGYQRWLRNLAVGLGNADGSKEILRQLEETIPDASELVAEHVSWAIQQQRQKIAATAE
jgi:epoxyqueuosine reductase